MSDPFLQSNHRLLVIDDNPAIHDDFRKILGSGHEVKGHLDVFEAELFGDTKSAIQTAHFEVDSATQGQEGLAAVQRALTEERPYAMAFIDVRMPPGWDGIETTARIWEIDPDLQVVICTAYSDYSWGEMIAKLGQSDRLVILKKPFDNVEVLQLANALTEKWRLQRRAQLRMEDLEQMVNRRTEELQRSEERFRKLAASLPIGVMETDAQGLCTYLNPRWAAISGRTFEESLGKSWCEAIHPEDWPSVSETWKDALTAGHDWSREARVLRPGGETRWISCRASEIVAGTGEVVGYVGTAEDITEHRRVEEELRRSHAETETLLASISAVLIGVGVEDKVVRWNRAAETLFGLPAAAALGRPLAECNLKWNWDLVRKAVSDCRERSEAIELDNLPYRRADGRDGCMNVVLTPSQSGGAEHLDFILLGTDTTQRRLMEGQLRHAQKLESIGQLAAGIAHEINTPAQFIGDNLRFLQDSFRDVQKSIQHYAELLPANGDGAAPPEKIAEVRAAVQVADLDYLLKEIPTAIAQSLDGVERVTKIVGAMKEFSHPGAEDRQSIDINHAIESTITVARNEWKYVADVTTRFDRALPRVPCLPGEFNQVILNIIVNAAHAIADTPAVQKGGKGAITVSTSRSDGWAEIRIADSGAGIPEAVRGKIFDPFFTTKAVGKGTGQGLFIAHNVVVEKHGGTITFETELGRGTTFIVRLPLDPMTRNGRKPA